eukprot:SAG31_NODE_853_length_11512_cov_42.663279_6_plen_201_part_00
MLMHDPAKSAGSPECRWHKLLRLAQAKARWFNVCEFARKGLAETRCVAITMSLCADLFGVVAGFVNLHLMPSMFVYITKLVIVCKIVSKVNLYTLHDYGTSRSDHQAVQLPHRTYGTGLPFRVATSAIMMLQTHSHMAEVWPGYGLKSIGSSTLVHIHQMSTISFAGQLCICIIRYAFFLFRCSTFVVAVHSSVCTYDEC